MRDLHRSGRLEVLIEKEIEPDITVRLGRIAGVPVIAIYTAEGFEMHDADGVMRTAPISGGFVVAGEIQPPNSIAAVSLDFDSGAQYEADVCATAWLLVLPSDVGGFPHCVTLTYRALGPVRSERLPPLDETISGGGVAYAPVARVDEQP